MSIKRVIKFFFQRRVRGWDDSETWDLGNSSFFHWVLPRLTRFKEVTNGYPTGISTFEEWTKILQEMIDLAQWFVDEDEGKTNYAGDYMLWMNIERENMERWRELWGEWQFCLWW